MTNRSTMTPPMAPPPPELFDDAITEILLRLPPDDPASLVRASLVCKLWRRILSDSTFPHRYREFHRTPPLLGFLCIAYSEAGLFFPITTRVPFHEPPFGCRAVDCRHGRVLLDVVGGKRGALAVWDPVTGDHKLFADPEPNSDGGRSGVVLCAAAGCNHRACNHGGPFIVVLVNSSFNGTKASAWMYSSDEDAWSQPLSVQLPEVSHVYYKRGALVGDQIYFVLTCTRVLKYDMGNHCLTMVCSPGKYIYWPALMTTEDGSLGFIGVKNSTLHLWARKANPNGSMGWVQDRAILLNDLDPIIHRIGYPSMDVIGCAEGVDIIFLRKDAASGFMFELKSGRFKKLSNPEYHYYDVLPYMSFYIPDFSSHKLPLI